jgi:hypothetical protein
MAGQNLPLDAISEIFSNLVKGVLAASAIVATMVKYIKEAGLRRSEARVIAERYELHGPVFWIINRGPHLLHYIVAMMILVVACVEIGVLVDQYTFAGGILSAMPEPVQAVVGFLSHYFVALFLLAVAFYYIMFELRSIENFFAWLIGLIPRLRNSIEWANAQWQIKSNADERRILAPSSSDVEDAANRLIGELMSTKPNKNLALRPAVLSEDSAANVLYFGHVVEQHSKDALPWTVFYEALGQIAETPAAPFSPEGIKDLPAATSFFPVLLQANEILDGGSQIPNEPGLEQAVDAALETLRSKYEGDARKLAGGLFGTAYGRVLQRSNIFLTTEGMRRQFAKLFILWNVIPGASRPDVFRIPFNSRMFIRYLDDGVIRADGTRFDFTAEPVPACFEAIQRKILSRVLALVNGTKDAPRVAWRTAEKADIEARKLDWTWWVYYRADQQAYHDAVGYVSTNWKTEANKEIVSAG